MSSLPPPPEPTPPPLPPTDLVLTSTTFELVGHRTERQLGVIFGLVVRSMGFAKSFTGGFSSLRQGEVSQYTEVLEDARRHALDRLIENARAVGANAVLGVRFDSTEIGSNMSEIVAYGTAAIAVPVTG
jgi:uncharacterized protein YbjQ (UPF0145 family)